MGEDRRNTRGLARRTAAVVLVVLLAAGVGTGAYFLGKSSGEDLDAARAEGAAEGREAGADVGTRRGFREGFREGREEAFDTAFEATYRGAYRKALQEAGLTPRPDDPQHIPEPEP
jgi:hypothetical protein